MANTKSAQKRIKSDKKKTSFNNLRKKNIKKIVKNYKESLKQNDIDLSKKILNEVYQAFDKAAKRGVINKQNANGKKSQLSKKLKTINNNTTA